MRLNRAIKDGIIQRLRKPLDTTASEKYEALNEREHDLAHKMYDTLYTAEELTTMETLGERFFDKQRNISASLGASGSYVALPLREPKYFAASDTHRAVVDGDEGSELYQEYRKIRTERSDVRREHAANLHKIEAALNGVTTVKKLLTKWPEIADVVQESLIENAPNAAMLPSVDVAELNEVLGLTKNEGDKNDSN